MTRLSRSLLLAPLLAGTFSSCQQAPAVKQTPAAAEIPTTTEQDLACMITATGIGPIHLGMTFDEARKAWPQATFERSTDGDGAALVDVKRYDTVMVVLRSFDEEDPNAPIDGSKRIHSVETYTSKCSSAEGLYPGISIKKAEEILGGVQKIVKSEIEQREFAFFAAPAGPFTYRIDYSGIYPDSSRETVDYKPDGKIMSITVSKRPD